MDTQKRNGNQGTAQSQHGGIFRSFCNMLGHSEDNCPGLSRRHLTTTIEGLIVIPKTAPLPSERQWCFECVGEGHLVRNREIYKQQQPPVTTYENIVLPRKHLVWISENFYLRKTFVINGEEFTVTDDQRKIKDLIMSSSLENVREFLHDEMEALEILNDGDFVAMRETLCKFRNCIDNPPKNARVSRRRFFFRTMNMAIFGMHDLWDGKRQVKVLKEFVEHSKLLHRQSLYAAYTYIFGYDKRRLDYFNTTITIIDSKLE